MYLGIILDKYLDYDYIIMILCSCWYVHVTICLVLNTLITAIDC